MTTPRPESNMGPFLQARLWARSAPRAERTFGVFCAVVVVAIIGWALVPEGGDDEVVGASDQASLASPVVGAVPTPTTPGAQEFATPQPVDAPVGTAPVGAAPTVQGGAPTPDTPPPAPGTGASGTSTTSAPATTSASEPRRASDRGVTADAIKVGLVTLNLGGLEAAGFAAGLRGDIREVIAAYVDAANAEGGINGRVIDPVVKTIDLVSEDDQRRKCLEFTQSDEVFSIVDSVGFLVEPSKACVTVENQTPLYTAIPGSAREISRAAPYQISPRKDHSRAVRDYVLAAQDDGFFAPANGFVKLGLVSDDCEVDTLQALKDELAAIGVTDISEYSVACDITQQRSVGAPAVLQHQRDGVTHVFFGIANPAVTNYTTVANNSRYFPKIFVSDWWTLSTDQSAEDFDPEVFDGARGVTATIDGDVAAGRPLPELTQKCSAILEAAGIPPITGSPEDIEVVIICEHFELFLIMARNAGVNPTRLGMVQGIGTVGIFLGSTVHQSNFIVANKFTGGDRIKISQWSGDCRCWTAVSPYRDGYG